MQPSASSVGQQAVPATAQADIPSKAAVSSTNMSAEQVQASVPSPTLSVPPPEDLYTYPKCTIMIVVQLRPQVEDGRPRPVLLSVQNGTTNTEDLPLYRLLSSEDELGGPFPPALVSLLEELQRELPARKQRHEQRVAKKSTAASASTRAVQKAPQVSAKDAGKPKKAAASIQPTLPVSPPATPLPKEGLVLGGLFDDL
jgi:hypothetical protein